MENVTNKEANGSRFTLGVKNKGKNGKRPQHFPTPIESAGKWQRRLRGFQLELYARPEEWARKEEDRGCY